VEYKITTSASTKVLTLANGAMATACFASPDNTDFGCVSYGVTGQNFVIATASGKTYEVPLAGGFDKAWFSAIGNHVLYFLKTSFTGWPGGLNLCQWHLC